MRLNNRQKLGLSALLAVLLLLALILGLVFGVRPWEREDSEGPRITLPTDGPEKRTTVHQKTTQDATTIKTPAPSTEAPEEPSSLGQYRYAAVAADAPNCSHIGVEMMSRHRGSAVDAAIAAMICGGVLNMHSTGVGGGHFMTVYDTPRGKTEKEIKAIIGRERAPIAAYRRMYVNTTNDEASTYGGLAIGVPGEVRGYHEAWKLYGRVPWKKLWEPSIRLCEEGHVITAHLARAIKKEEDYIRKEPNLRELLVKENNELYGEGDYIKRPRLATTLRRIAEDPFEFYTGSLADDIIADIQEQGGIMTREDLEKYTALVKEPLATNISDTLTAYAPPAPSGGPILTYILNILRGYNFGPDAISTTEKKTLTYHRIVEAFKHAYAKRSLLGDEDYVTGIRELTDNLTNADFGEYIRSLIRDDRTLKDIKSYNPGFLTDFSTQGTSHLSVLGPDGSAVGMTSTINTYFGSKVRGSRTGIIFNNEMDDFSSPGIVNFYGIPASPSNYIKPGKRPQSSMCPAIILDRDGNVVFVTGAEGGSLITTTVAFVAMETLWFGMPLQEAEDTLRFHHQLVPNVISYEEGFPQEILEGLQAKGHKIQLLDVAIEADVQSIHNKCPACGRTCGRDPCIDAVTDRRKPSKPDGY